MAMAASPPKRTAAKCATVCTPLAGPSAAEDRDPESIDQLLESRGVRPIDFAGWKKVDAFERAEGAKEGREHKKVIEPDQMRELALA